MSNESKTLRIGNAGGYWGDDPGALRRQLTGGHLDYISMDFLAEITMSIMRKQKSRDASLGYARDFPPMIADVLGLAMAQKTRIVANAGGVNPLGCAEVVAQVCQKIGLNPRIAVVHGDDILDVLPDFRQRGISFQNMDDGRDFSAVADKICAANIYFGAAPIVQALQWQPDIVITGRVTDTGITLAPMIYEFGWSLDDWDRLAAGIVAGHLMECGAQATGGNFTDWHKITSFQNIGFPVVEMQASGEFVLTKHPGTGGLVSVDTAREQIFYEMGNPFAYISPDVVADFSTIQLAADGNDRVRVRGVKGYEPTPFYKVSMAYSDGFKCSDSIMVSGPNARAKAEVFSDLFWNRCADLDLSETNTEYLGWNSCHQSLRTQDEANEIVLRLAARAEAQEPLQKMAKLVPALILSGPPGVCVRGGVAKPQEVISYWPALFPKKQAHPKLALFENGKVTQERDDHSTLVGQFAPTNPTSASEVCHQASRTLTATIGERRSKSAKRLPLSTICLARSGDKGDMCNIGVIARSEAAFEFLDQFLRAETVKNWFQELCLGSVTRYRVAGLHGHNFLLERALGGGGTKTLRTDAQGKTFAQALLAQEIEIPAAVLSTVGMQP